MCLFICTINILPIIWKISFYCFINNIIVNYDWTYYIPAKILGLYDLFYKNQNIKNEYINSTKLL